MAIGNDLGASEVPTPILAARLATVLRTGRRDAGIKLRHLARASGGAYSVAQLRALESGAADLAGVDLLGLSELYRVDLAAILLERVPLVIDQVAGRIQTAGITRTFELGTPDAMLIAYLKLVRELRDLQHEPTIVIRRADVDVLAAALAAEGRVVVEKLGELMHLTVAQRRSMVAAFVAGATVIALAGGALAVDNATYVPDGDGEQAITSISASEDLTDDDLSGSVALRDGSLIWSDADLTEADPVEGAVEASVQAPVEEVRASVRATAGVDTTNAVPGGLGADPNRATGARGGAASDATAPARTADDVPEGHGAASDDPASDGDASADPTSADPTNDGPTNDGPTNDDSGSPDPVVPADEDPADPRAAPVDDEGPSEAGTPDIAGPGADEHTGDDGEPTGDETGEQDPSAEGGDETGPHEDPDTDLDTAAPVEELPEETDEPDAGQDVGAESGTGDDIPEDTTPEDTTPEDTTPEDTTPEDTTPEDTTPEDTTPEDDTSAGGTGNNGVGGGVGGGRDGNRGQNK